MKLQGIAPKEKCVIICIDEMSIKPEMSYRRASDQTFVPSKKLLVVMLRGLYAEWKQPIFFDFDTCLTAEVFLDIIQSAHTFVFTFMVYERKQRRRQEVMEGLWSNTQKFFHTASSEATQKLFFFSDPQHLIKLIRNHCIDSGVTLADGARVDRLLFQSCYWLIALN